MQPAKTALLVKAVAIASLTLGFVGVFYTGWLIYQRIVPPSLAFSREPDPTAHAASVYPKLLVIDELDIVLPIAQATIVRGIWETNPDGVSFLTGTAVPGEVGNSILYGHNWPNRLGRLKQVKPGMKIQIVLSDGSPKTFKVEHTQTVSPDQTHIVSQTTDRRITLYTCTGFLDSKRFVVTAVPVSDNPFH